MIIVKVEETLVCDVFVYPDGTDSVVVLDNDLKSFGDNPVAILSGTRDITEMDDIDIETLNSCKEFTRTFGTLVRTGKQRLGGKI